MVEYSCQYNIDDTFKIIGLNSKKEIYFTEQEIHEFQEMPEEVTSEEVTSALKKVGYRVETKKKK